MGGALENAEGTLKETKFGLGTTGATVEELMMELSDTDNLKAGYVGAAEERGGGRRIELLEEVEFVEANAGVK